jgi:hypothetical protein
MGLCGAWLQLVHTHPSFSASSAHLYINGRAHHTIKLTYTMLRGIPHRVGYHVAWDTLWQVPRGHAQGDACGVLDRRRPGRPQRAP